MTKRSASDDSMFMRWETTATEAKVEEKCNAIVKAAYSSDLAVVLPCPRMGHCHVVITEGAFYFLDGETCVSKNALVIRPEDRVIDELGSGWWEYGDFHDWEHGYYLFTPDHHEIHLAYTPDEQEPQTFSGRLSELKSVMTEEEKKTLQFEELYKLLDDKLLGDGITPGLERMIRSGLEFLRDTNPDKSVPTYTDSYKKKRIE